MFGSGDIFSAADGLRMFEETGCDAVMIGRGGYGNPWLIGQLLQLLAGEPLTEPVPHDRYLVAMRHLQLHQEQFGRQKTMLEMRKHLCWYARGLSGAGQFRAMLQKVQSLDQIMALTESFFSRDAAA